MIRAACIQHVPFEGPGAVVGWANNRGYELQRYPLYNESIYPAHEDYDLLIILGGPMSIFDERGFPFLVHEKVFIQESIEHGKNIVGICLGAQLLAHVLGASVIKNTQREIGWYKTTLTEDGKHSQIFGPLPSEFMAFHWHEDTFDIPPGAVCIAKSNCTAHQAFEYGGHVVGLQFHLETNRRNVDLLLENSSDELVDGPFIQSRDYLLHTNKYFEDANELMSLLLDNLLDNNQNT
jgi:GMP synthase-like glutamine amidotransferase